MTTATMNRRTAETTPGSSDVYADAAHSKSVMRQTQVLIGLVLLAGVAGASFVSMAWVAVPVAVGLGLLLAGMSGVCPMASVIACMPWNKAAESEHRASPGGCCGGRR